MYNLPIVIAGDVDVIDVDGVVEGGEVVADGVIKVVLQFRT